MAVNESVPEIFWPIDCNPSSSGLIIGWNIRKFKGCVAMILPSEVNLDAAIDLLALVSSNLEFSALWKFCTVPIVLGWWQANDGVKPAAEIENYKSVANFWVNLASANLSGCDSAKKVYQSKINGSKIEDGDGIQLPTLSDLFCCNSRYRGACHIVFFHRPPVASHIFNLSLFQSGKTDKPVEFSKTTDLDFILRQINVSGLVLNLLLDSLLSMSIERKETRSNPATHMVEAKITDSSDFALEESAVFPEVNHAEVLELGQKRSLFFSLVVFPIRLLLFIFHLLSDILSSVISSNLPYTDIRLSNSSIFCMLLYQFVFK